MRRLTTASDSHRGVKVVIPCHECPVAGLPAETPFALSILAFSLRTARSTRDLRCFFCCLSAFPISFFGRGRRLILAFLPIELWDFGHEQDVAHSH